MRRTSRPSWLRPAAAPRLAYQADLIGRSVRTLDKKWTLLILRDMAFLGLTRFTEFLRNNPGLTPRVLSRRLKEMRREQLVTRSGAGRAVVYALTARGQDAVFILLAFLRYGQKYHRGATGTGDAARAPIREGGETR